MSIFYSQYPRKKPQMTLISSEASIYETCGKNKYAALNRRRSTYTLPPALSPKHRRAPMATDRQSKQNTHTPVSAWNGLLFRHFQLLPQHLISNQPSSRCWVQFAPLEHGWILAYPSIQGDIMEKKGSLDNDKGLRDNEKLEQGLLTRLISYMRSLS